ncbi:hypothetical protein SELR_pSRC300680 (plasmid) [Selenomonas ruminantium subsp. lactilytica TAM6421]|uniref:Uncharacterized protein n=1 Tax=Selenomonas ruminantium subsp. lactilytica (strain NBRC 103574 / TAM6421) TaxID=927704 RepID=I0GWK4_SELRL|nr:hypothetical protein [Selenomonas ruminantium]BAL85141.1 hypothetical protein SELR_pSRC300680 [Selenomonas ruminantium subsp. lactilytica TAM6421]
MNHTQLENLAELLEMFSKKYPDRSPESIKQALKEALKGLSEVKPMTTLDEAEYNSCQLFDTGRFNDIVLAYIVLAMKNTGMASDEAMKLLGSLENSFDELTATQALQLYRGELEK